MAGSRGAVDGQMGKVDRANSFAPIFRLIVDTVAQIFCRYWDPIRDDAGGLQVLE